MPIPFYSLLAGYYAPSGRAHGATLRADMYAFFDYRTVAPHHIPPIEQHYARVYLVAWSMGVGADTLAPICLSPP